MTEAEAQGVGIATFFSSLARHGWKKTEGEHLADFWYDRDVWILFHYDEEKGGYCKASRMKGKKLKLNAFSADTLYGKFDTCREGMIIKEMRFDGGLIFRINIAKGAVSDPPEGAGDVFDFTLKFTNVISYFATEIDTYQESSRQDCCSNFEEVTRSRYLKKLKIREDWPPVKHYRLYTYDDVYDVLASGFVIEYPCKSGGETEQKK